jgi:peptidoglycan/LPS O-acetylase OafA/YrhL
VNPSNKRLILVDALRGIAALIVVLHHARTLFRGFCEDLALHVPALDAALGVIARRNVEAVLLFFVISGFSIRLSVERDGLVTPAAVREYYKRRALRIAPLYWVALGVSAAVAFGLAPVSNDAASTRTLIGNLLFLQTAAGVPGQWFLPYAGNGALWSLSFEVFYYIGYPWLVRAMPNNQRRAVAVLAISLLGFVSCEIAPNPFAMFCGASLIWYFGVELAEVYLHDRSSLPRVAFYGLWILFAALRVSPYGLKIHGVFVGCSVFLIGSALIVRTRGMRLPSSLVACVAACARVGEFSYGLYLLHVPILRAFVALAGQGPWSACAAVGTSLVIAKIAENAASVSGVLLTTQAMVAEKPKKAKGANRAGASMNDDDADY